MDKIGEQKQQFYFGSRIEGNFSPSISFNTGLINYLTSILKQFIYYKRIAKLHLFFIAITHRSF